MTVKKYIASIVLTAFIVTSLHDFVWAQESIAGNPSFILPPRLGKIIETYDSGKQGKVICIQDLHCHAQVQDNIYNIIKLIKKTYGKKFKVIGIEGAYTNIDTSILSGVPDINLREKVSRYFVKKGDISGPELYSIMEPSKITLQGIENRGQYLKNFNMLYDSFSYLFEIEKVISKISQNFNRSKQHLYPKQLLEFEKEQELYEKGEIGIEQYLTILKDKAEGLNLRFKLQYPEIEKTLNAIKLKKQIKKENVTQETQYVMLNLLKILKSDEYKRLESMANSGDSDEYYLYLKDFLKKSGISISKNYKHLHDHLQYLELITNINDVKVLEEKTEAEYQIKLKLIRRRTHGKLLLYCETYLNLLNEYLANRVTSKDAQKWALERRRFFKELSFLTERIAYKNYFEDNKKLFFEAEKNMNNFYNLADKRNEILSNNISKHIKKRNRVRVMVIGGYHTDGIKAFLKSKGISYEIIMPAITEVYTKDIYLKRVYDQADWLAREKGIKLAANVIKKKQALMVLSRFFTEDINNEIAGKVIADALNSLRRYKEAKELQESLIKFLSDYTKRSKGKVSVSNVKFIETGLSYTLDIKKERKYEKFEGALELDKQGNYVFKEEQVIREIPEEKPKPIEIEKERGPPAVQEQLSWQEFCKSLGIHKGLNTIEKYFKIKEDSSADYNVNKFRTSDEYKRIQEEIKVDIKNAEQTAQGMDKRKLIEILKYQTQDNLDKKADQSNFQNLSKIIYGNKKLDLLKAFVFTDYMIELMHRKKKRQLPENRIRLRDEQIAVIAYNLLGKSVEAGTAAGKTLANICVNIIFKMGMQDEYSSILSLEKESAKANYMDTKQDPVSLIKPYPSILGIAGIKMADA
ncbi:hypothetical protein ACFL4S_01945, partial [bacterium]